jgi:hypothetical protein
MNRKNDEQNRQAEVHEAEYTGNQRRAIQAFATLRLLNQNNDAFSLRETMERIREMHDSFQRWENSGALIRDIAVRLSDGKEIAMDQSQFTNLSLCGVHFRNAFLPNTVLHVYKKADEQFEEVQLLAVELRGISHRGYNYTNTYKNGQTLALKAERCKDGQFYITVECSDPEPERAKGASGSLNRILPYVVTAGLLALQTRLSMMFRVSRPSPSLAYGVAVISVLALIFTSRHPGNGEVQNGSPAPRISSSQVGETAKLHKAQNFDELHISDNVTKEEKSVRRNRRQPLQSSLNVTSLNQGGTQVLIVPSDEAQGVTAKREIVVSTTVDTDAEMVETLRSAFVRALENTQYFLVRTDSTRKQPEYRLDLRFVKKNGFEGVIFAEFYDEQGGLAWYGNTECRQFREAKFFNDASQALVSDILYSLNRHSSNTMASGLE